MTDSATKWDRIYQKRIDAGSSSDVPAYALTQSARHLGPNGLALDIACGLGNNARFLAGRGYEVNAWDISEVAISALSETAMREELSIVAECHDITPDRLVAARYDLIVNCHYLDRSLFGAIREALVPGGLVCFQTFTRDKVADVGPSSAAFLLAPGELIEAFSGFEILAHEDQTENPDVSHPLTGREFLLARRPY